MIAGHFLLDHFYKLIKVLLCFPPHPHSVIEIRELKSRLDHKKYHHHHHHHHHRVCWTIQLDQKEVDFHSRTLLLEETTICSYIPAQSGYLVKKDYYYKRRKKVCLLLPTNGPVTHDNVCFPILLFINIQDNIGPLNGHEHKTGSRGLVGEGLVRASGAPWIQIELPVGL